MSLDFGKRLREMREEKGLTQAELAKLASLGESTISFTVLAVAELIQARHRYWPNTVPVFCTENGGKIGKESVGKKNDRI